MYKGGKNHIRPTDFLNFYMCEKGREENQREYQSLKERLNASEIVNILSGRLACLRGEREASAVSG